MFPGLEPGTYRTKAGSIVTIGGKHGGRVIIDFDWCEEDACCEADPFVMEGALHWTCECHEDGSADLEPCDPREGVCGQREAVRVVCDKTNNPPEQVAQGIATVDVDVGISALDRFHILVDALRETRRAGFPDEPVLFDRMEDLVESMSDHDRDVANSEGWRGWPDQYDARMKSMVENVDPDDPSTHGNPPRKFVHVTEVENKPCEFITLKFEAPEEPKVLPPDEARSVTTEILPTCAKHGVLKDENMVTINERRWCAICVTDLFYREDLREVTMKRVDK